MSVADYRRLERRTRTGILLLVAAISIGALDVALRALLPIAVRPIEGGIVDSVLGLTSIGLAFAGALLAGTAGILGAVWICPNCGRPFHGFFRQRWYAQKCRRCGITLSELEQLEL